MEEIFSALAIFILPGTVGGLVRGLVGISKNVLAAKEAVSIPRFLFSLIVAMIVGAVAAALTGGDWRISLLAGYAGADIIEALYKTHLLKMFKMF